MSIFRIQHNNFEKVIPIPNQQKEYDDNEWEDVGRLSEGGWENRYQYEASIVLETIKENNCKTILEIGCGPGRLSHLIQQGTPELDYHLIDKPNAKSWFEKSGYKGTFFIKDLASSFDTTGLYKNYDMIMANDFLEHIFNPSIVLQTIYGMMKDTSVFFISVPNWRMAHQFIYRGLWDYDHFVYMMFVHGFDITSVYPSILQTPFYPKLDSEKDMPDELIQSWNFYFVAKKRTT